MHFLSWRPHWSHQVEFSFTYFYITLFLLKTYYILVFTMSYGNGLTNLTMYDAEKALCLACFKFILMWHCLAFLLQKVSFPFTISDSITEFFIIPSNILFSHWRFKFKLFYACDCYYILSPVSFLDLHSGSEMGCVKPCVILQMG